MDVLHKVMQDYPVDADRICLAGVSTGGSACWEMAMRYPDMFAAVVPMASWGGDMSRAARLARIPIWTFHNRDDDTPTPVDVRRTVKAVEEAGGNIHLTLVPATGHNCWYAAFKVHDAMGWMLLQRRGALICWAPPGLRPWSWWHVVSAPCALVAIMWLGWRYGRKRRIAR
jgi:predicted peptidase